jgi:hypothetical protein
MCARSQIADFLRILYAFLRDAAALWRAKQSQRFRFMENTGSCTDSADAVLSQGDVMAES